MLVPVVTAALLALPAPAAAAPSDQDAAYLRAAHQGNLAEIAGGRLAEQKAHGPAVRRLGARFVADHTRMDAAVRDAAAALGVDLPAVPNPVQQALAEQYRAASPPEFDALFISTQLTAHTEALQMAQAELTAGADPRATQVAKDAAPIITAHHELLAAAGNGYAGHGGRK